MHEPDGEPARVDADMRLQKFLSRAGIASRRAAEDLIEAGRVRVDGRTVRRPGVKVHPTGSVVEVDGRRVELSPPRWIMVHKPTGCVSTRDDPRGRRTVYDLLPSDTHHLFHVGRLDYMSEGLLLLTNEGDVANAILHPSGGTVRRYEVDLAEPLPEDLVGSLVRGVRLEDGIARASAARLEGGAARGERRLVVELLEGRNREIRRMMDAAGARIHRLRRVAFGPIALGGLPAGAWRDLTQAEVETLRAEAGARAGGSEP